MTDPATPLATGIALAVEDLACRRGGHRVFSGLSFSVAPGALTLVRGPNGAGKSSLLLTLAGLLRPETGTVRWSGLGPEAPPHAHLHLIGHRPAVKSALTAAENLGFWMRFYGAPGDPADALARVGLGPLADIEAAHLSAGQVRRLALARLIACPRPVWLLDEPTAALDAQGDALVGDMIASHLDGGGLVVAATHLDLATGDLAGEVITMGAAT